jgi:hypothetical protein
LADKSLKYKPSKAIVYCTLKDEVNEFYDALNTMKKGCEFLQEFELFKLYSDPSPEMKKSLQKFTNHKGKSIMINIRMLNDGINVPDIDTVLFTNPMKSKPDIIQRIFRARRTMKGRPDKIAYVIIPVTAYNIKDGMYDMILQVLQELIEGNDPSVIMFRKQERDRRGGSGMGGNSIGQENLFDGVFMEPEAQHFIINDIDNIFAFMGLYHAVLRATKMYPMTINEICEYININQLTNFVVAYDACKQMCANMVMNGKLIYDEVGFKYYNAGAYDKSEHELEFREFLNKMSVLQITDESSYNQYYVSGDFDKFKQDPVSYFKVFGFNWGMVRPLEEKSYDFNTCKEVIAKLLENEEIKKHIMGINGYVKRIKFLRKKDQHIPHQEKIKEYYKLKNMIDLHKLLRETND